MKTNWAMESAGKNSIESYHSARLIQPAYKPGITAHNAASPLMKTWSA
jgi:hypothetical protein